MKQPRYSQAPFEVGVAGPAEDLDVGMVETAAGGLLVSVVEEAVLVGEELGEMVELLDVGVDEFSRYKSSLLGPAND